MALPTPDAHGTYVVTGASSGIGAEIARVLAARRLGVTLVARREDRLKELADELARNGVRVEVVGCDLTDASARIGLLETLGERGLTIDGLINNAGFGTAGPVTDCDPAREMAMVRTNVEAVIDLCSRVVPGMVKRGRGAVLNVASTAAFQPLPGQAGYAATKAFVLSYTDALHAELHGTGVSVTTLCPGPVETEFTEVAGLSDEEAKTLPKVMWVPATTVARMAVDGMDKGRRVVIPGMANRVSAVSGQLTPRTLLLPLLRRTHPSL